MFVPIGTDAPLYHRPLATGALIAANVGTFWHTWGGTASDGWILRFGHLAPSEWISSAFLHFGPMHLIGNMIFLWVFGLIVEGKLGWWKFLLLYGTLCALDGFVTQLFMLNHDGITRGAGGASGVIYALMGISLVWAPKNCIDVLMVWFIGIWGRAIHEFEVTVLTFSLYYIGTDFLISWLLYDFQVSTPVLHLLGACVGFPIGVLLLRRGWVDCEGWDLFSVIRGAHQQDTCPELGRHDSAATLANEIAAEQRRQSNPQRELRRIRHLIRKEQFSMAWLRYRQLQETFPDAQLDPRSLRLLIDSLRERGDARAVGGRQPNRNANGSNGSHANRPAPTRDPEADQRT